MATQHRITHKLATAVKNIPPNEDVKARVKLHVHLCALCFTGIAFLLIFHYHVDNEMIDSFGPLVPNVLQEVVDELRRL